MLINNLFDAEQYQSLFFHHSKDLIVFCLKFIIVSETISHFVEFSSPICLWYQTKL